MSLSESIDGMNKTTECVVYLSKHDSDALRVVVPMRNEKVMDNLRISLGRLVQLHIEPPEHYC